MANRLKHRGPDSEGYWVNAEDRIALSHRRLSIIDLSQAGHQPMESACKRYVISYNGEIYNFMDLRKELEAKGARFKGSSDTEVLLTGIADWGLAPFLRKATGMFAFALWDRKEKNLSLARDRFGEKPLYYTMFGKAMAFASELKSFREIPGFSPRISRSGLSLLFRFNYIPSPHCIYEDTYKVNPGEILTFSLRNDSVDLTARSTYWDLAEVAERGAKEPFEGSFEDAVSAMKELLTKSVRRQMVSDVPLGAFLSGGIDSSLVTSIMQSQSSQKIKTFSIGFEWKEFDEAVYAKRIAQRLGTEHSELYVTSREAMSVVPMLPELYDEPFADFSQIPTFLLCRMARKDVTVALTGDGADEIFFGYDRYFRGLRKLSLFSGIPGFSRRMLRSLGDMESKADRACIRKVLEKMPAKAREACLNLQRLARKAMDFGGSANDLEFYLNRISHECRPERILGAGGTGTWTGRSPVPEPMAFRDLMMYVDTMQYLPDDILVKIDRAGMAVSLETRVPFLDHEICEFAWRLPFDYKYEKKRKGKRILKRLLSEYLPDDYFDRPKKGFGPPVKFWLRNELRDWGESLVVESKLRDSGFSDPEPIVRLWRSFQLGTPGAEYYLWNVLTYQSWFQASRR